MKRSASEPGQTLHCPNLVQNIRICCDEPLYTRKILQVCNFFISAILNLSLRGLKLEMASSVKRPCLASNGQSNL